jgi:hypothetical protein
MGDGVRRLPKKCRDCSYRVVVVVEPEPFERSVISPASIPKNGNDENR